VASSKTRQRKLARAKMERQLVRRAAKARRRRQVQAGVAVGVAVLVLVFGALWFGGVFEPNKPKTVADDCAWTPAGSSSTIGMPPTTGIAKTGTEVLTIATDQGNITASVDLAKTPCTAASLTYLGSKGFYNNTACTRLTTAGSFLLKCGDPTGDGTGSPGYTSIDENIPAATEPTASPSASASASASPTASASPSEATPTAVYPRGSVVMEQTNGPNTNGSQFFVVYQDSRLPATMTIVGTVTQGLEIVDKVAAGGVAAGGTSATDGQPNTKISIKALSLAPAGAAPSDSATPSPSASAAPSSSTSPSTSPSASS